MSATSADTSKILGFPKWPRFVSRQPRFPTDSFLARYLNYLDVIDPRTLLASEEEIKRANRLLADFREGRAVAKDEELWKAQKLHSAIFHPDTGERILPPFRMSGFVPFGWITVTGMLLPNPSWASILFWQWANQSHNAAVNYSNRNATQEQPLSTYLKAYGVAVSSAMSVSALLTYLIRRTSNLSGAQKMVIQRFVPLPATSLASTLNVVCMRAPELKTGITVMDADGKEVGISRKAAKKAVYETALTRAFLPIPLLLAPPCIMPFLEKMKFVRRSPVAHLFVNAVVCTISFGLSLPVALALFPQESSIKRSEVEEELQKRTNSELLFFNKGL